MAGEFKIKNGFVIGADGTYENPINKVKVSTDSWDDTTLAQDETLVSQEAIKNFVNDSIDASSIIVNNITELQAAIDAGHHVFINGASASSAGAYDGSITLPGALAGADFDWIFLGDWLFQEFTINNQPQAGYPRAVIFDGDIQHSGATQIFRIESRDRPCYIKSFKFGRLNYFGTGDAPLYIDTIVNCTVTKDSGLIVAANTAVDTTGVVFDEYPYTAGRIQNVQNLEDGGFIGGITKNDFDTLNSGVANSGLVVGTEGTNTGYWLKNDDRTLKGDIGQNAVDLSSGANDHVSGAFADYSHTEGGSTTTGALYSVQQNLSSVAGEFVFGFMGVDFTSRFSSSQDLKVIRHDNSETYTIPAADFIDITFGDFIYDGNNLLSYNKIIYTGHSILTNNIKAVIGNALYLDTRYSHAEGYESIADGFISHAEGEATIASGRDAHAEGGWTKALGDFSHAEGDGSYAIGNESHAEGRETRAIGARSHAEGGDSYAIGEQSHAEGMATIARGDHSHAEGSSDQSFGHNSHAEGIATITGRVFRMTGGTPVGEIRIDRVDVSSLFTLANDLVFYSTDRVTEYTIPKADLDSINYISTGNGYTKITHHHAGFVVSNYSAVISNIANSISSTMSASMGAHVEGSGSQAIGDASHAEGGGTISLGLGSHSEGWFTIASGTYSHAEGELTKAVNYASHAEGSGTIASGSNSHAEGNGSKASGFYSHAEGLASTSSGTASHSEGDNTKTLDVFYSQDDIAGSVTILDDVTFYFVKTSNLTVYRTDTNTEYTIPSGDIISVTYDDFSITTILYNNSNHVGLAGNIEYLKPNNYLYTGHASHAEGFNATAFGRGSHAEGWNTRAVGEYSHAEGAVTFANGNYSHSEGSGTRTLGMGSHAEGIASRAIGDASHAEGGSWSLGNNSHAEGASCRSYGEYSHAEGMASNAYGDVSHAEGGSYSFGAYSHSEGVSSKAYGYSSHAEGDMTKAIGYYSHVEGLDTKTGHMFSADSSTADVLKIPGNKTQYFTSDNGLSVIDDAGVTVFILDADVLGVQYDGGNDVTEILYSNHPELIDNVSYVIWNIGGSWYSHAEGSHTTASGYSSHAEGTGTTASGDNSHAEGNTTIASGDNSHTEGLFTTAWGSASHAEGNTTIAGGENSHAEGYQTTASGYSSHAEGNITNAIGIYSHAEGDTTIAGGPSSHTEGKDTNTGDGTFTIFNQNVDSSVLYTIKFSSSLINDYLDVQNYFKTSLPITINLISGGTTELQPADYGYSVNFDGAFAIITYVGFESLENDVLSVVSNLYKGSNAHAEGYYTNATGQHSHAEGQGTTASGFASHASGNYTTASGYTSTAMGDGSTAKGRFSFSEGQANKSISGGDISMGAFDIASNQLLLVDRVEPGTFPEVTVYIKGDYTSNFNYSARQTIDYVFTQDDINSTFPYCGSFDAPVTQDITYDAIEDETVIHTLTPPPGQSIVGVVPHIIIFNPMTDTYPSVATAIGMENIAGAPYTMATGQRTKALGKSSFASGFGTTASGEKSHTEGYLTTASGVASHAEGWASTASGNVSHTEGTGTIASATNSHAEGYNTTASDVQSHAEGYNTTASGPNSHAEGDSTVASGDESHAEGQGTIASANGSHAEGWHSTASGINSHSEGTQTTASGADAHSEGYNSTASGSQSHAEGNQTTASGLGSHAEGSQTTASGESSHTEGYGTIASEIGTHAEGHLTTASGWYAHAEGELTIASGRRSHASGYQTTASGDESYTEGHQTTASGSESHAEGRHTIASGIVSHAEGADTTASGTVSHAEGYESITVGEYSHAEGFQTIAIGNSSHAEGRGSKTGYTFIVTNDSTTSQLIIDGNQTSFFNDANDLKVHIGSNATRAIHTITGADFTNITYSVVTDKTTITYANNTILKDNTNYVIANVDSNMGSFAHAEGFQTIATGPASHAEGTSTIASAYQSHAEGELTIASGSRSHAEGAQTTASGGQSHAEGSQTTASGGNSHAEGYGTVASESDAHAEGHLTTASGLYAHAEGESTIASGRRSHASGLFTIASGESSHSEGDTTKAEGYASHAEGAHTTAIATNGHAEGYYTTAIGNSAHAEGYQTTANGPYSHAECYYALSIGSKAHAEGDNSIALGEASHAEGDRTIAVGYRSHAEGYQTKTGYTFDITLSSTPGELKLSGDQTAYLTSINDLKILLQSNKTIYTIPFADIISISYVDPDTIIVYQNHGLLENDSVFVVANIDQQMGWNTHAEGSNTIASGWNSHAEGHLTTASGWYAHAEGNISIASGYTSHAEGENTTASGTCSHAEGENTTASGYTSHAEGSYTTASGENSHTEGYYTTASGNKSHAEGNNTTASGQNSHAQGNSSMASGENSHAGGEYSTASGQNSTALGGGSQAWGRGSFAVGSNNKSILDSDTSIGFTNTSVNQLLLMIRSESIPNPGGGPGSLIIYVKGDYTTNIDFTTRQSIDIVYNYNDINTINTYSGLTTFPLTQSCTYDNTEDETSIYTFDYFPPIVSVVGVVPHTIKFDPVTEIFPSAATALGSENIAGNAYAMATGLRTKALGKASFSSGFGTIASGSVSHAEGEATIAFGYGSHAEGVGNEILNTAPAGAHVEGIYANEVGANKISVIGIGTDDATRIDGRIMWMDGTMELPVATNELIITRGDHAVTTKKYVDDQIGLAITTGMSYKGGYDAALDTPSLDGLTPITGIKIGDTYTVTVAGNFFTEAVEIGDTIIARQDSPTTLAHWVVVQANMTPQSILAALLTVDGTGSLLDADLLDGQHGSYYLPTTVIIDEDNMVSNSDTKVPTQQSVKAYVDGKVPPLVPFTTSAITPNQIADTNSATAYRTVKYIVSITSGTAYQSCELLVCHDGTTAKVTEYANIYTGSALSSFDADVLGGNIRLLVTPVNAITTYKILKTMIEV